MAYRDRGDFMNMNKLLVVVVVWIGSIAAHQQKELFLKGVAYYDQGNIKEALSLYQSIAEKSPAVFYNIGMCDRALGNYPQALSAFRNAEQNADPLLMKKLNTVIQDVKKKLNQPLDSSYYRLFLFFASYISIFFVQILFLGCLFWLMILWWLRLGSRLHKVFIFIALMSAGFFCGFDYWLSRSNYAIVIHNDIPLYAGPDVEYHKLFSLPAGQEVKVVEQQQSWYKVYSNGMYGWLEEKNLERLI